jgi:hypothetical protein
MIRLTPLPTLSACLCLSSVVGCAAAPEAELRLSYASDIEPVFQRCDGCHLHGFANGGLALDAGSAALVGVPSRAGMPYVTVGEPEGSYLLFKLEGTQLDVGGFGAQMPIGLPLESGEIALVERWISEGALP